MAAIWSRLGERNPADWRHVYKALLLLDNLLRNGNEAVITELKVHSSALHSLQSYQAIDEGRDTGESGMYRVSPYVINSRQSF